MKWLSVLVVLFGCSGSPTIDPPLPIPDASPSPPPDIPECQPEFIDRDIYHCGACDNRCPPADTDRCEYGECWCGVSLPCDSGRDCRRGQCILSDPEGSSCEFDEQCDPGHGCIEGHCSFVECVPEVCDGVDNDCDGLIDNQGANPISEFCIGNRPAESSSYTLPCQEGVRVCNFGAWTDCIGDVPPVEEIGVLGCDGIDNDCDGCIDAVLSGGVCETRIPTAFDVLFLIDVSGSMGPKIEVVRQAVRLFSSRLAANPMFRWGIVRIPGPIDGDPDLYQDLDDFTTFEVALDGLTIFGGIEPQWSAVIQAVDGTLGVSWTPSSTRILILFTDENGQASHLTPADDEEAMCDSLTRGEVLVSVIQSPHGGDFDDCSHEDIMLSRNNPGSGDACTENEDCAELETCNAAICVSETVVRMALELSSVISDPCGGV